MLDENGDGWVSPQELIAVFAGGNLTVSEEEIEQMFATAEKDASGQVNFDGFVTAIGSDAGFE